MSESDATKDPESSAVEIEETRNERKRAVRRVLLTGVVFLLGFIVLGVIAIQVWEYSNSVEFCADACHDVHPEEIPAYKDSYHAGVKCTECHMGRMGTIRSMILKASHIQHLPEVIFDRYDRPVESETMRPANESCELCHWPPAFHGDAVREIKRFQSDEENTEQRIYLLLRTGAGTREQGLGYGIHWHVSNPVEYIAEDEHKQEIRWVRTTLPDGRTVEYNDVTNPLTQGEIEAAEKRVMDCVDCHNRMGHPFPSPEDLADEALADGRLSTDLPFAKKVMLALLTASHASQEDALAAVGEVKRRYIAEHLDVATVLAAEIGEADQLALELLTRLVFDEPGVTWRDFPDNNKHKDFPGCFRCHDGNHQTDDGESIRLHCNICHSIPMTVGAGDRPPEVPIKYIQEPPSHLETTFMADHRFQANGECVECHGEIEFGSDDSSFCANSACHGRAWPLVELDAATPHPIELEGKHAEVWCHDCHEGVREPEYACANCHEPPEHHLPGECDTCHSPSGFVESVSDMVNLAPAIPHEVEGREGCLQCHEVGGQIKPAPSNHTDYISEQCTLCHKVEE